MHPLNSTKYTIYNKNLFLHLFPLINQNLYKYFFFSSLFVQLILLHFDHKSINELICDFSPLIDRNWCIKNFFFIKYIYCKNEIPVYSYFLKLYSSKNGNNICKFKPDIIFQNKLYYIYNINNKFFLSKQILINLVLKLYSKFLKIYFIYIFFLL